MAYWSSGCSVSSASCETMRHINEACDETASYESSINRLSRPQRVQSIFGAQGDDNDGRWRRCRVKRSDTDRRSMATLFAEQQYPDGWREGSTRDPAISKQRRKRTASGRRRSRQQWRGAQIKRRRKRIRARSASMGSKRSGMGERKMRIGQLGRDIGDAARVMGGQLA